jgi:HEAT repeat protein
VRDQALAALINIEEEPVPLLVPLLKAAEKEVRAWALSSLEYCTSVGMRPGSAAALVAALKEAAAEGTPAEREKAGEVLKEFEVYLRDGAPESPAGATE